MNVELGLHFSCSSTTGDGWPAIYQAAVRQAQLADRLGFRYGLVAEHHFMEGGWIPAPFLLCAAIAQATERLHVGPNVVILPFHHPIHVVEQIAVLDNLSSGRAICAAGMGARESEFASYGVPFKQRVSRTEEALQIIKGLLAEDRLSHEGKYFSFSELSVTPPPQQAPAPPIWYGAISEAGARRAARLADALVIGPVLPLAEAQAIAAAYRSALAEQPNGGKAGRVILRREGHIASDSVTAWRHAARPLHHQYASVYTKLDLAFDEERLREYAKDRFIVGGPDEVLDETQRFAEATGADAVVFRLQLPGLDDAEVEAGIRLLGERVAERLGT